MEPTTPKWSTNTKITFTPPKREVHTVYLHCSASDKRSHDDVSVIRKWHETKGWSGVGYHYFITKEGHIQEGRPLSRIPAAQGGRNTGTIAICCHGLKEENFTAEQLTSVYALCAEIRDVYADKKSTAIRFRGHKEVANKACPVYDYKRLLELDERGFMSGTPPTTSDDPDIEPNDRLDQLHTIQDEAAALFKRKNNDYGDAFASHGVVGVLVRLHDKLQRAISISEAGVTLVNDEALRDTLIDTHNYAAMAIMLGDED